MKKTLVALAAVSAVSAFAQTSVTLTGRMDAGYQSINFFGQKATLFQQNGASTSAIKFTAKEDLGAGLTAAFMYEIDPLLISGNGNSTLVTSPVATATTLTSLTTQYTATQFNNATQQAGLTGKGEQYVMISDAMLGSIKMGTPNTATLDAFGAGSPFGTAVGSGYGSTGIIFSDLTRIEASAKYESPVMNGLQFSYLYTPKNDNNYGTTSSTGGQSVYQKRTSNGELGLHYVNGPLVARAAIYTAQAGAYAGTSAASTANNVTTKTTTIGASYDFGFAKLHGTIQNVLADNATLADNTDTKATSIGFTVPMGANRFLAKYSTLKKDQGASYVIGQKSTMLGLGWERDLSKNTYFYARYEAAKFNASKGSDFIINGTLGSTTGVTASTLLTDPKRTTMAVGLSMGF